MLKEKIFMKIRRFFFRHDAQHNENVFNIDM